MDSRDWADAEFGHTALSDERLRYRLVRMAARVAARPSGVVSQVFEFSAERQGAYDLLGNERVRSGAIIEAVACATARRCSAGETVHVILDGTRLSFADPARVKELGSVGARKFPTRGIKVVNAYAVDDRGVPLGLLATTAWRRGRKNAASRFVRRGKGQTEMAKRWCPALDAAAARVRAECPSAHIWAVGDRECDDTRFLRAASQLGTFTVRAAQNRLVTIAKDGRQSKLFSVARAGKSFGYRTLELPPTPKRAPRNAVIETRVAKMTVLLPDLHNRRHRDPLEVSVVYVREVGPVRGARLEWRLLTNAPVESREQVDAIVASYRLRWRVEEYHRALKAGGCNAEMTQLRTLEGIVKWVTLLGSVASRAERLKYLSRTTPDAPATEELSEVEIVALILAKRKIKNSVEQVPDGVPTLAKATLWIADIGGYAGHYKKGRQPGATTIMRGLERLAIRAEAISEVLTPAEIKRRLR